MPRICVTRALKNARHIQSVAPRVIPANEPAAGFASLVPLEILSRFHQMKKEDLARFPGLQAVPRPKRTIAARNLAADPLFSGTLYFVQVTFDLTNQSISISNADMATMVQYATLAAPQISAYATQYGGNSLSVSQNVLQFTANVPNGSYNDQTLQGWVNTILTNNGLTAGSSCIVIPNPQGVANTDGDINQGILGYHGMANSTYCFINVFGQNLAVADQADVYAQQLSHEIAEMTVDPRANNDNPEVCDACGPNCQTTWRDFFVSPNNAYSQSTQTFPPGFGYVFFINAIVQPNSSSQCPAPQTACAYAPPYPSKTVTVRRSTANDFGPGSQSNEDWTHGACFGSRGSFFADVDGDGLNEIILVNDDTITVRRNTGSDFGPGPQANEDWSHGPCYGSVGTFFADVDGDGRADCILVNSDTVTVRRSTGSDFGPGPQANEDWTHGPCYGSIGTFFADVDGDGKADIILVNSDTVTVRRSTGSDFGPGPQANEDWTHGPYFGNKGNFFVDVTGDGRADAIVDNG